MPDAHPFRPSNAPDIRTFALAQMAVAMSADRTNPTRPFRELRVSVGDSVEGSFRPNSRLLRTCPTSPTP